MRQSEVISRSGAAKIESGYSPFWAAEADFGEKLASEIFRSRKSKKRRNLQGRKGTESRNGLDYQHGKMMSSLSSWKVRLLEVRQRITASRSRNRKVMKAGENFCSKNLMHWNLLLSMLNSQAENMPIPAVSAKAVLNYSKT